MTTGAKVILAAALLCFLIWGAAIAVGFQPLVAAVDVQVIYSEGEDFFSDAVVYQKARNRTFTVLNLPHARPAYRWWTVDFGSQVIRLSGPPRSLGSWRYVIKSDLDGATLDDKNKVGNWYWHFTGSGAAFSGNGFSCRLRNNQK